jgi:hypothetical protein
MASRRCAAKKAIFLNQQYVHQHSFDKIMQAWATMGFLFPLPSGDNDVLNEA